MLPSLESIIHENFPTETIIKKYDADLISKVDKITGISVAARFNLGTLKPFKLIETSSYFFVDHRIIVKLPWIIISQIFGIVVIIFIFINSGFLKSILGTTIIWTIFGIVFLVNLIQFYRLYFKGYSTEVYRKEWVKREEQNQELTLDIIIPAYSKFTIWSLLYQPKILDKILLNKLIYDVEIVYKLRILDHKLPVANV